MKKISLILLFLTLFILSCSQNKKLESDRFLEDSIREQILSGQETLDFKEIAKFKWDSLIILTPYSNPECLSEQLKVDFSQVESAGIQYRDDINLIVFIDKGKPVKLVEYPRYPGDFADNEVLFITKSKAKYQIIVTDQISTRGDKWIKLILI